MRLFPRLLEACVAEALLLDGLLIRRPRTHDQMVCFLVFGRRGVWQPVQRQQAYLELAVAHLVLAERWPEDVGRWGGSAESGNPARRAGSTRTTRTRGLETEGLSLGEQVRAGTLEESARAKRLRRLRTLGGSLFPRRSGNPAERR